MLQPVGMAVGITREWVGRFSKAEFDPDLPVAILAQGYVLGSQ